MGFFGPRKTSTASGKPQPKLPRMPDDTVVALVSPDVTQVIHIYRRDDRTFGLRAFSLDPIDDCWTPGDWGHWYDSVPTALREACDGRPWVRTYLS
jgi:hypothetical protein